MEPIPALNWVAVKEGYYSFENNMNIMVLLRPHKHPYRTLLESNFISLARNPATGPPSRIRELK